MRATDLNFRSPKERTAEYTHPLVTFDGRSLPLVHTTQHPTFSKARRFSQYEYQSRKTGQRAGPGSYDLTHHPGDQWKIKGTPVYKSLHQSIDTSNNGFYFYGNSIVYEPSFVLKSKASKKSSSNISSLNKDLTLRSSSVKNSDPTMGTENKDNTGRSESKDVEKPEESKQRVSTGVPRKRFVKLSGQIGSSPYLEDQIRVKVPRN